MSMYGIKLSTRKQTLSSGIVTIGGPERQVRKAPHYDSSMQQYRSHAAFHLLLLLKENA